MLTTVAVSPRLHVNDEKFTLVHLLEKEGFTVKLIDDDKFSHGKASDEEEIDLLHGAAAVIAAGERYSRQVIESLPDLRLIARLGVGSVSYTHLTLPTKA